MMKKIFKSRKALVASLLVGVMTIGGMTAYFTDTESVVNEFTVGKISIKLTEPGWNPENGIDITPLKEVTEVKK